MVKMARLPAIIITDMKKISHCSSGLVLMLIGFLFHGRAFPLLNDRDATEGLAFMIA